MKTTKPGRLGDLKSLKVKADGQDITNAVLATHVWQDIFTPGWSCSLVMGDTNNVIHTIPLKQGTILSIQIETSNDCPTDGSKTFEFVLQKITNRRFEKNRMQSYVITGISKEFIKSMQKRVSQYYTGTADSIASSIMSEHVGGSLETDSSNSNMDLIIPRMAPFTAISWLCKMANDGQASDFIFFMKDSGSFVMKRFENLYNEDCGYTLKQKPADERDNAGNIEADDAFAFQDYLMEHHDAVLATAGGMFGSTTYKHDLINKEFSSCNFSYGEDCPEDATKKDFGGMLSDAEFSNVGFYPKHKGSVDQENPNDSVEKWAGSRKSSLLKLDQNRLIVQLPGGVNYWSAIGKGITVEMESHEDMSGEKKDKYYRGKYLVAAVNHTIQGEIYTVNLELLKKRLDKPM